MDVVELRVRGVGGETAEEILGGPVRQIDGDAAAGFYERADGRGDGSGRSKRQVEAYEWGRLTSGPSKSALWWVLLPFSLLNVAGWLLAPPEDEVVGSAGRVAEKRSPLWWVRLFLVVAGGVLTAFYLLWLGLIAVDLVAFGCGTDPECVGRGPLHVMEYFESHPAWLLALGVALWAFVWFLLMRYIQSSQSLEGYERDPARRAQSGQWRGSGVFGRSDHPSRLTRETRIEHWTFWYQWREYRRLWVWHLLVTAAVIGAGGGFALGRAMSAPSWPGTPDAEVIAWSMGVVVTVLVIGFAGLTSAFRDLGDEPAPPEEPEGEEPLKEEDQVLEQPKRSPLFSLVVGVGGAALTAAIGGTTAWFVESWEPTGHPPFGELIRIMTTVAVGLALVLLVFSVAHHSQTRRGDVGGWRPFGLGPLVASGVAVVVAAGGFAGLAHVVGRSLIGSDRMSELGLESTFPEIFVLALAAVLLLAFLSFLFDLAIHRERREDRLEAVYFDYDLTGKKDQLSDRFTGWARRVRTARGRSGAGRQADFQLGALFLFVMTLFTIQVLSEGSSPSLYAPPLFGSDALGWLHTTASFGIVLFLFPGLQLIRLMFGSRDSRRQLGKVWDVVSFWPRRYHPLGAPCYAERAVPELRDRIMYHLAAGRGVIVKAHSQGTVIAVAALSQIAGSSFDGHRLAAFRSWRAKGFYRFELGLEDDEQADWDELGRVALVTFGSPLRSLYRRFFPSQFGRDGTAPAADVEPGDPAPPNPNSQFEWLRRILAAPPEVHGWQNFYRPTDYIGRSVFLDPPDEAKLGDSRQRGRWLRHHEGRPADDTGSSSGDIRVLEANRFDYEPGVEADHRQPLFPPRSHSDYWREPQLREAVDRLTAVFREESP